MAIDSQTRSRDTLDGTCAQWPPHVVDGSSAPSLSDVGCREWVSEQLRVSGAVVLRGFGIESHADFAAAVKALSDGPQEFLEESSPRTRLGDGVFTSTDYPASHPIQFHSEHSYADEWPMKLFFACLRPADTGGRTPLANTRAVMHHLDDLVVRNFIERGILCERIFGPRRGVTWQEALGSGDRAVVEETCVARGMEYEWLDTETLCTRRRCDAVFEHPYTDAAVWFNHALIFNVHGIEPKWLRDVFARQAPSARSTNTYYGDGSEIPADIVDRIRQAYQAASWEFDWERGDLLVIDNMLIAHGRTPFEGPREIVVAMSEPIRRSTVQSLSADAAATRGG